MAWRDAESRLETTMHVALIGEPKLERHASDGRPTRKAALGLAQPCLKMIGVQRKPKAR